MKHQFNCSREWKLLLFRCFVFIHILYTSPSLSVNLTWQYTSMLKGKSGNFFKKMRLLARRYLGSSYRCIAIWSQIILLTKRQNGSKLKWENCSHYPKVRLDKQTLLFLPLTHICLEGPLGSRGSQKFHCQKYLRNFLQTVLVILCAE